MLKFIEYALLSVSLLIVLGLVVMGPGSNPVASESTNADGEGVPPLGSAKKP